MGWAGQGRRPQPVRPSEGKKTPCASTMLNILDFDFMRETQYVVTGQSVFSCDIKKEDWAALSVLHAPCRLSVPARTALAVKLNAKELHGNPLSVRMAGFNSTALEGLGMWNTLDTGMGKFQLS